MPKTVLVTGATNGLGRAVARALAADGWDVAVHGRDRERLGATVAEVRAAAGGGSVRAFLADLADLAQVRDLAADVRENVGRLDVLLNNAGVGFGDPRDERRETSVDGHELRFAVNHLAGFLLTLELLPLLRDSAPARIVNVASLGQAPIDFADAMLERGYGGTRAYGQSKLAQIMSGFELAERLPDASVTVNALHPGTFMPTGMVREARRPTVDTLETGVTSVVRLVTSPELDGVTGRFYDRTVEARVSDQAYDVAARRRLWDLSVELTGAKDTTA